MVGFSTVIAKVRTYFKQVLHIQLWLGSNVISSCVWPLHYDYPVARFWCVHIRCVIASQDETTWNRCLPTDTNHCPSLIDSWIAVPTGEYLQNTGTSDCLDCHHQNLTIPPLHPIVPFFLVVKSNHVYLFIYLFVCLFVCLSVYCLPIYQSTYLPIYLSTYLHIYLPTYLPTYPPIYLPMYLSSYLAIYLSTYLPIYLSTHLPIYLSTYLPIYLSIYLATYLSIFLSTYLSIRVSSCCLYSLLWRAHCCKLESADMYLYIYIHIHMYT